MATYGKKLLDSEGNIILPKTRSSLVYMDDNSTVEDTIKKILSGETPVEKAIDCSSAGNLRMYNTNTKETCYVGLSSEDPDGTKAFLWDATHSKSITLPGIDTNAVPKTGCVLEGEFVTGTVSTYVIHNPFRVGTHDDEFFRNIMISQNQVYQAGRTTVIGTRE